MDDFEHRVARMLGTEASAMALGGAMPRAVARRARIRQARNGTGLLTMVALVATLFTLADLPEGSPDVAPRSREVASGVEDGAHWTLTATKDSFDGPCISLRVNGQGIDCAQLGSGEGLTVGVGYIRSTKRSVVFGALPKGSQGAFVALRRGPTYDALMIDDPASDRAYWLRFLPRASVRGVVGAKDAPSSWSFSVDVEGPTVRAGFGPYRPPLPRRPDDWREPGISVPLAHPGGFFDEEHTVSLLQNGTETCLVAAESESCARTDELGDELQLIVSEKVRGRSVLAGLIGDAIDEVEVRVGSDVYAPQILRVSDRDPARAPTFDRVARVFIVDERRHGTLVVIAGGRIVHSEDFQGPANRRVRPAADAGPSEGA